MPRTKPCTKPRTKPCSIWRRCCALFLLCGLSLPAHAYLDPGTGSLLLQGAIAGIAALGFTLKLYWYRIRAFLRGEKYQPPSLIEDPPEKPDQ